MMNSRRAAIPCFALAVVLCGSAQAQLAPFALAVSETVAHQSNLFRAAAGAERADWVSTTGLRAEFDGLVGRQRLKASVGVDVDRYRRNTQLNYNSPKFSAELDWTAAGLLAGELGLNWSSSLYQYGLSGGVPLDGQRNIDGVGQVFSRVRLGGVTQWTFLGGVEALQQSFSAASFAPQEVKQWSADLGARYQASPDLRMTGSLRHTQGRYPRFDPVTGQDDFTRSALDVSSQWVASGASAFDLVLGYTLENHGLQADRNYWNGALRWLWTPSARLKITSGLRRDANASTSLVTGNALVTNLYGSTLNTGADLFIDWAASAKINVNASANQTHRAFNDSQINGDVVSGTDDTALFSLGLKYLPTQSIELGCNVSRERRTSKIPNTEVSRPYAANAFTCMGKLWLR